MSDPEHIKMRDAAFQAAAKLTGGNKPTSDQELQSLFNSYAPRLFASEFGYNFESVPPDSLRAKGVFAGIVSFNTALNYIEDFRIGAGRTAEAAKILFLGLNVPFQSLAAQGEKNTADAYERIIGITPIGAWATHRLDMFYDPSQKGINPERQSGVILAWYDAKTLENGQTISFTWIYAMMMFYEIEDPTQIAMKELVKLLIDKLQNNINGANGDGPADLTRLTQLMSVYTRGEFQKSFGVEFNGNQTLLPNSKLGGRTVAFEAPLTLGSWPAATAEVESWMNDKIMRRDGTVFPSFAQGAIYDDIRDHVLRCSNGQYDANTWYHAQVRNFFLDPDAAGRDLQQCACYLFAYGDLKMKVQEKEVEVKKLFVYYLGAFSGYQKDSGAASVSFDPKKVGSN